MASPEVKIELKPPLNNDFYSTNDRISGSVKIQLSKALSIKTINVILKGFTETLTKVDPVNCYGQNGMMMPMQDNRSYHTLFSYTERLFPPSNVWDALEGSSKPFKVKPGQFEYKFAFAKLPRRPKCLTNHTKGLICFTSREQTRMPPSYNNEWRDLTKVDNLDLFFYAYGKVLYMVQVQIQLGKSTSWYRPFDKLIRQFQMIEFIPEARDLAYDEDDEKDESPGSSRPSNNLLREKSMDDLNMNPLRWDQDTGVIQANRSDQLRIYKSSFCIGLPDRKSAMWVEVRSKGLRETFRNDNLFCAGSNKFDKVYLVIRGDATEFEKWSIVPTKIQLNLLEIATYLSQGVANENFSSLRLADVSNIPPKLRPTLIDFESAKVTSGINGSKEGRFECEIKLRNHPMLKRLKFNEEDYRHRGNRLYSFKTCTIKRVFNFQLLIDWDINGISRQTEVIVRPMQIFVQTNQSFRTDVLPKYVEPPIYTEAQGEAL